MAKLVLSYNGAILQEYELDQEMISIGRKSDNDIQIDNPAISGHHAKILTILNDSFLEDLSSTNGTYINGNKIVKHALNPDDVITIGKHKLKYVNEAAAAGGDFEKTMVIRPDAAGMPVHEETDHKLEQSIGKIAADLASAGVSSSGGPGAARLKLLSGANNGKELKLTKIITTLGKPGVQVAAITRRPTGYFFIIVDAGPSGKMPLVNGKPMGKKAHALSNADEIEVAGVQMGFYLASS